MEKEGFILYKSFYTPLSVLTDEQLGRLFRAIFNYQSGVDVKPEPDIYPIFLFIKNQFDVDDKKYQNMVERNTKNIHKRWNTKNTNHIPNDTKNTSGKSGIPKDTKNTNHIPNDTKNTNKDKDKDIDKDIDIKKDNTIVLSKESQSQNSITNPADDREERFNEWMKQFPTVQRMDHPLTLEQYVSLKNDFGLALVEDKLRAMENKKNPDVVKAYKSASQTLRSWCRLQVERDKPKLQTNPHPEISLGPGEFFNAEGVRTYGSGYAVIPLDAPPRPSDKHTWNTSNSQWTIC